MEKHTKKGGAKKADQYRWGWIDINKGDNTNPLYRSRLVAKEFNDGKDDSLYAGTPPLEALRLLVSEAATIKDEEHENNKVIMINDVARAFFEAPAHREICVWNYHQSVEHRQTTRKTTLPY